MLISWNAGADIGATEARLCTDHTNPGSVITLPNYLWTNPNPSLYKAPAKPEHGVHLHVIEAPCEVPGEYAFGQLAVAHGEPLNPRVSKLVSPQIRAALVALLAVHAARDRATNRLANPVYNLAVGIPMLDYTEEKARDAFLLQFRGTYRVRFDAQSNPRWAALGEITFYVQGLLPVCEGLPALDVVPDLDESAMWQAVADVGGSTLDVPVFERMEEDGQIVWDLKNEYCGTAETGLNDAMDQLALRLNRTYPDWTFTRTDFEHYLAENDGQLPNGANIRDEAERHLRPVAARVAMALRKIWNRRPEVRTFILIGGGAVLLHKLIHQSLTEQGILVHLKLAGNSRLLNVLGFALHARGAFGNG